MGSRFCDTVAEKPAVECLMTNHVGASLGFKAGGTAKCLSEWKKITRDPFVFRGICGTKVDLAVFPVQEKLPKEFHFTFGEKEILYAELTKLLEKGVIEKTEFQEGEYISNVFLRPKSNGGFRVILDLSMLNKDVTYTHFKMESLHSALALVSENCFMGSIDLRDAYYSIPICKADRKWLRFIWKGQRFQYTCLPNGLAQAPRYFTKFMKPVFGHLQERGHTCFGYIDDSFVMHETREGCQKSLDILRNLLANLGFVVHPEKSVFTPTQKLTFLGYEIDTVQMVVRPTTGKISHFSELANKMLNDRHPKIRQVASLVGTMVDLCKGCEYGMKYYRALENDKIQALKKVNGNFEGRMRISQEGSTQSQVRSHKYADRRPIGYTVNLSPRNCPRLKPVKDTFSLK